MMNQKIYNTGITYLPYGRLGPIKMSLISHLAVNNHTSCQHNA